MWRGRCGEWPLGSVTHFQVMDAICLLYLVIIFASDSGGDTILRSDGGRCVQLVLRMLRVQDGPLDDGYSGKVSGLVSSWFA